MDRLPLRGDRLFGKAIQIVVQNFLSTIWNDFNATLVDKNITM
jgi:hypothetical protein